MPKSRKHFLPNSNPAPIGFSRQPGQYESRRLTSSEEIFRVILIVGAQCFLGFISLLSLYTVIAIVGPVFGYVSILALFVYLLGRYPKANIVLAPLGALWFLAGYAPCAMVWISNPVSFFHPFAQGFIAILFTCVAMLSGWGVYILFLEVTDPNWPSPRQAVLRDGPFIPGVSQETYGGQLLPELDTLPSLPSRTVTVQLDKTGDGRHTESVARIPDIDNYHKFFFAVTHHGKGFTEATAKAYSVPLNDVKDQAGQLIIVGMRTLREQFLARGWLEWKNPTAHERGVKVTKKGMRVMEAMGKES